MIQTTLTQTTGTPSRGNADSRPFEESLFGYVQGDIAGWATNWCVIQFPGNYRFNENTSAQLSSFPLGLSSRTGEHWVNAVCLMDDPHVTLRVPSQSGHFHFMSQNPSQLNRAINVSDPRLPSTPHLDPLNIGRQLERIGKLNDGWADGIQPPNQWGEGFGKAPSAEGIDWLTRQLAAHYAVDAPKPYIYPTPEGGVSLEWSLGPHRASLEIDFDTCQAEWHCLDLSADASYERDLRLDISQSWKWLVSEVRRLGDPAA